jgi:hypothetical protein
VLKVFCDLYDKGLIYRGLRMVNWDPKAQTVLSTEEVIYRDEKSKLYSEGIMTKLAAEVQEKGYQYWDWNGATGDGTEVTAEEAVAEALSSNADTIVLLAHDGPLKESTAEALPAIIEGFWDRGYTFKPLSREATVVHHEIVN